MTHYESLMLAVCFGVAMGQFIANLINLIVLWHDEHRRKKQDKE